MKLPIPCSQCLFVEENDSQWHDWRPVNDTCIYEVTCPQGHNSMMVVQNFKFELLFESGIKALKDGYYREATTTFAVALERFYEFSIIFLLIDKLANYETQQINEEGLRNFEKFWKTPLKLSERQLGAFYALYFDEFGESPMILDQSFSKRMRHAVVKDPVNFRNRAVHEGYIPTHEETVEYGEAVHLYINSLLDIYHGKSSRNIYSVFNLVSVVNTGLALIRSGRDIKQIPASNYETFINSVHPDYYSNAQPLREYIENGPRR